MIHIKLDCSIDLVVGRPGPGRVDQGLEPSLTLRVLRRVQISNSVLSADCSVSSLTVLDGLIPSPRPGAMTSGENLVSSSQRSQSSRYFSPSDATSTSSREGWVPFILLAASTFPELSSSLGGQKQQNIQIYKKAYNKTYKTKHTNIKKYNNKTYKSTKQQNVKNKRTASTT